MSDWTARIMANATDYWNGRITLAERLERGTEIMAAADAEWARYLGKGAAQ